MKFLKKTVIPVFVSALMLSGCSGKEEEGAELSNEKVINVEALEMHRQEISKKMSYAGKVNVDKEVNVTPKVAGQVDEIFFDVGDTVKEGDILFTIDTSDYSDQLAQLNGQLKVYDSTVASAEAALSQVNGGQAQSARLQMETGVKTAQKAVESAEAGVENAKASLSTAEANYKISKSRYDNYTIMYESGVISKSDYNAIQLSHTQAENALEQAKLGVTTAENGLETAKNSYAQAKESLEIYDNQTVKDNTTNAQNAVNSAKASRENVLIQIEQLKSTIEDAKVKSPISGVISARNIEKTNMVSAASVPFTIVNSDVVAVDVNISESLINVVNVGDKIDVEIASVTDEALKGVVKTVAPAADSTGTYPVKIEIPNSDGALKKGMVAKVNFIQERNPAAIVVPRNVVLENEDEKYVYVANGEIANKVVVETGIDNGEYIEISSGINEGDAVIVTGQSYLSEGSKVNIVQIEEE